MIKMVGPALIVLATWEGEHLSQAVTGYVWIEAKTTFNLETRARWLFSEDDWRDPRRSFDKSLKVIRGPYGRSVYITLVGEDGTILHRWETYTPAERKREFVARFNQEEGWWL